MMAIWTKMVAAEGKETSGHVDGLHKKRVRERERVKDGAKILEEGGCINQDEASGRAGYRTLLEVQTWKCQV